MNLIACQFEGARVRVLAINGEPWFVGKDVAEVLGYTNTADAISRHCKGVVKRYPLQTAGGIQETRIINQSDMLRLIVGSTLPAAQRFERWVFEEVLPSILRTGSYSDPSAVDGYFSQPRAAEVRGANTAFWLLLTAARAARALGVSRDAAIIAANRTVAALTGVDVAQLMEIELPKEEVAAIRPEAEFLLAWQNGQVELPTGEALPFVPCTGRQLHTAFLIWCREQGVARPAHETVFIGYVGRRPGWQAGKAVCTLADMEGASYKSRKMVIPPPDLAAPAPGQRETHWLSDGYFTFRQALGENNP